ncbi:MAG: Helix-turn-helix domain [Acidimicrobiaceae bacterium]|nr:Helix-turn-helix domain [Acidimicrobiaceae bacterium]
MAPRRPEPVPGVPRWARLLAERRLELGLTQQELGRQAGLTQQAVSYIERGASIPRFTSMVRLARVLGTSVDELFGPSVDSEVPERGTGRA